LIDKKRRELVTADRQKTRKDENLRKGDKKTFLFLHIHRNPPKTTSPGVISKNQV